MSASDLSSLTAAFGDRDDAIRDGLRFQGKRYEVLLCRAAAAHMLLRADEACACAAHHDIYALQRHPPRRHTTCKTGELQARPTQLRRGRRC